MKQTQQLEYIREELYSMGKNFKDHNEIGLGTEFEETAEAIRHLVNVYNYGYEGYEVDVWSKHVSTKLNSLKRVIKVKNVQPVSLHGESILGALAGYENMLKRIN